jgi:hypothetical protein
MRKSFGVEAREATTRLIFIIGGGGGSECTNVKASSEGYSIREAQA